MKQVLQLNTLNFDLFSFVYFEILGLFVRLHNLSNLNKHVHLRIRSLIIMEVENSKKPSITVNAYQKNGIVIIKCYHLLIYSSE